MRNEMRQRVEGAPPRDMAAYTRWRYTDGGNPPKPPRIENLRKLGFYGTYLMGQYSGMGEALNLQAMLTAFEIEGIPREQWPELSQQMLFLHGQVVSRIKKEAP